MSRQGGGGRNGVDMPMTNAEREAQWDRLVASFPGDTHEDKKMSVMLFAAREMIHSEETIRSIHIEIDGCNGRRRALQWKASRP